MQQHQKTSHRPFNPCKERYTAPKGDFNTAYLYAGDNAFLHPKNITELLSQFLFEDTKNTRIFPRYHQWEAARKLRDLCLDAYHDDGKLGEKFLFPVVAK